MVGDPVDRDQRAVQDRVRQLPDTPLRGGVQVVGGCAVQGDYFLDVAPGGAHSDLEAGGGAAVGVAVAQVGQGEQCLPARLPASPPGFALLEVAADAVGEVVQVRLDNVIVDGWDSMARLPRRGIGFRSICCPTWSLVLIDHRPG